MAKDWRLEINRILFMLLAGGLLGFLFGNVPLFLFLALLVYVVFSVLQLRKLDRWLGEIKEGAQAPPPESYGFWGQLFDAVYRLHRDGIKAREDVQHILARAQKSVAALDFGIILIDRKNALEWWNTKAEALLGIRFPVDRGQNAYNLIRDPRFTSYFSRQDYTEPLIVNAPVNNNIILEFNITRFGENEKLMIVRDVTQVQKLEMMRKDFVGNVSHELRTPITVISGYLETLLENNQILEPRWKKALEQMHQQSLRMENILRDLLILSRLETRAISLDQKPVNVSGLLKEIKGDTLNIFEDKDHSISVECDDNLMLTGDRGELYSAISNLSINAAKYTPAGGRIVLRGRRTATGVEVCVEDNGIGIAAHHIPRLTERFYRVDVSRSSSTGGTGLGLAIVKHILARHGATLHIESEPGSGSRFCCRFSNRSLSDAA
ncbi:MAG: phosphate regulon sensor histidine kinase PhoR [Gammaproteobacteria bacterium]|nr:phosphate regulon sensor histidine kinase PhoR [Pseudomonadales bacterium]MCP5345760.1 phosphate regulon sensor histidine kinase PhoR [Pseudomonadales bacterium]